MKTKNAHTVSFFVTNDLKKELLEEAALRGINLSQFVREALQHNLVRSRALRVAGTSPKVAKATPREPETAEVH